MSGIFGFYRKQNDADTDILHALDVWNKCYGREGSDTLCSGNMGAGCHLEHFSDRYPAGAPVFETDDLIAVVDALLYNREELIPAVGADGTISDEALLLKWIELRGY